MRARKLRLLWPMLLFLLGFPALATVNAQTNEADIAARLLHHPLFLRGSWGEDKLRFDGSGMPLGDYEIVPFTLAAIDISKVRLDGNVLAIEGNRTGVEFREPDAMRFVALGRERIRIEVKGTAGQDFGPALDAIFAEHPNAVPDACTGPWKRYAEAHWPPMAGVHLAASSVGTDEQHLRANGLTAPRVLQSVDPVYSNAARARHYSGVVSVRLIVDAAGLPSHPEIDQPAGLGLDEQAIGAVEQYRFAPATRDGMPVPVQLTVQVRFRIF